MSIFQKKSLCVAALGAGLLIGYAALATAPDDGGEPPKPVNECSPGFWKNHPEYWANQYCGSTACVADVLEELTSQGKGSDERRHDQAGALNAWADTYYGGLICTE